ncbi:cupredoxin domain-containing protein [Haliea sp. E1-2-M8]|uniref:cupredoxin domain-containing protein n=1 Tax=Haliea sp. E1-2-M8 TaxID=3064706 RepID=UPI002728D02A|nr:cupredoxin domain-containing protein [Haliea sp. E1-2-M8]MDO8860835.1 cupredoxin domain-containing protein [Haliea sp. E1-2-M8]
MNRPARLSLMLLLALAWLPAMAKTPIFELDIRDHLFHPEEIRIPANTKVKLVVYNRDPTPEEFESYELNREKVIMGGRKANIFIGPLAPGVYPFFGEFNPRTAQGRVVVE